MTRIFLPPDQLLSDQLTITGENAKHLALVLRIKANDLITVFDGQGSRYECRITSAHKKEVLAEIITRAPYSVESPLNITLAQGIARGEKMDLIIQKATELGVNRIVPLITQHTQVRQTHKIDRWKKIAQAASQQSAREQIPLIEDPVELNAFTNANAKRDSTLSLILYESHDRRNLKDTLRNRKDIDSIIILVGPEGGFSQEEVSSASEADYIPVSLGPRILRTETAPLAAISIIQYELGDAG
ncbi:MAG: 16S rRNA (uracil(1498)-N(3))-methyltransferase [Nitrospira sp.]|nr:16S rRNA (uracil(1498)-N(3))-methyltransferase [bacterium]MBL7049709.1 16S rRNA (uracil(1498)-N(3))-methyltransferase [Nitrospira sp.]